MRNSSDHVRVGTRSLARGSARPEGASGAPAWHLLDGLLERSPTLASATVACDGSIKTANAAFRRLAGPVESLDEVAAEGQEAVLDGLLAAAGPEWRSASLGIVGYDGALVDCHLSAVSRGPDVFVVVEIAYASADRLNAHLLDLNDELIGARRELADRNRTLRELDEVKNMFITSATHDLKTPISSILGFAEIIGEGGLDDDETRRMVGTIERNARRVVVMIDDLLAAALVMTGELRLDRVPFDLAALVRQAVVEIEPITGTNGVTIDLDASAPAVVLADELRIMQILDNLLSNAVKYSPDGGRVKVSCSVNATTVSVSVADCGIGVEPEEQAKLFTRFFRSSTARSRGIVGTGLGLANARSFAEAHGGTVTCTSEVGVGSTFVLTLPLADSP